MRNLFTALAMGFVLLFTACETQNETGTLKHLSITSESTILMEAKGGNAAITYNIREAIAGQSVTSTIISGNEMINDITHPTTGVILVEVKANNGAQRVAIIKLSYGEESTNITIQQKGSGSGGNTEAVAKYKLRSIIIEQNIAHSYYWIMSKKKLHLFCTQMTNNELYSDQNPG